MSFDPNDKKYDTEAGKFRDLKKAGTYLLGTRQAIKHDTTQNGKEYTRFAFVVIGGPQDNASFVDRVFRSPSSYKRLAAVCRAMRITEQFDPGNKSDVERVMVGRALKSSVTINDAGYAELKYPETEVTGDELAAMREWEASFKRQKKKELDDLDSFRDDDPGPSDADFPGNDDFGDDSIPF